MKPSLTFALVLFFLLSISKITAQSEVAEWQYQLQKATHDTMRLQLLLQIVQHYRGDNEDSVFYYLQKVTPIVSKYPNYWANAELFMHYGYYFDSKFDYQKAKLYFQKAVAVAKTVNNTTIQKRALFNIARLDGLSDYAKALKGLAVVEKMLVKEDPPPMHRLIYNQIAELCRIIGDTTKALSYINKSLLFCTTKIDSIECFMNISALYRHENKKYTKIYEPLVASLFDELTVAHKNNIRVNILDIPSSFLANATDYFIQTKQYHLALKYLKIAEKISIGIPQDNTMLYQNIGEVYNYLQKYHQALYNLKKSNTFALKHGHKQLELFSWQHLALAYQGLGNYKAAFEAQQRASKLNEELTGAETQRIVAQLNAQYELNEKQAQIAAKELENKIQQTRLQTEQRQKNILLGIAAIAIALLVWAAYNYYRKTKLSQQLELQTMRLSEANRAKDKLFAIVSHDLRSPISRLTNSLALIDTKGNQLLQSIKHELSHTQLMLSNLLQWASWQMQQEKIIPKHPTLVAVAISDVIKEMTPLLETKQIKLITQLEEKEAAVAIHEAQFQIIIRNIISNAIKFTPLQGYIRVQTMLDDSSIIVIIKDSGIGMDEEQLAKVFDYPTSRQGTMHEKGSGLGLSLCKELIEKNNGSVTIRSTPNKGTEVKLEFPTIAA